MGCRTDVETDEVPESDGCRHTVIGLLQSLGSLIIDSEGFIRLPHFSYKLCKSLPLFTIISSPA